MTKKTTNKTRGFSLIETVIYTAMLSILVVAIVICMIKLFDSYKRTKVVRQIETSALNSMDRIIREIRGAESVGGDSAFNTTSGILSLISGATTIRFYLSDQKIYVAENGVTIGALTNSSVKVSSLIFRYINATSSDAVKVEMTFLSSSTPNLSKNFYNTSVLMGSY